MIRVNNGENETVYPQMADFTFYGGLYRDVKLICVSASHFDLDYYGSPGLQITPEVNGHTAHITAQAYITDQKPSQLLRMRILDREGSVVSEQTQADSVFSFNLENVHLWQGRKDPYLYTLAAELLEADGQVQDAVSLSFGCRSFQIDPDQGFLLNGEPYPLRGVARHQDRWGVGNALLPEHHEEDMDLICELGATTIRLAHYQQDSYFYDLCDQRGMVVWAEIPYISQHMPEGRANTISQMKELILQNHHHASIVVWGLSNEITMKGDADPDLLENHQLLNDLAHRLDPTRLTTLAALSTCPIDSPYLQISDVVSYNHYFGWYGGDTAMNGPWFDRFHARHPKLPIGCSEYGCEALNWHTSQPVQGDYTEEYQAHYHEELIRQFFTRPYLWATHVWNMFDFGADARNEGGENGQNHKGLVTFDRKYKKDAFYAYKAWLSDEPFVHICGKRYVDRVEAVTRVTVYTNQPECELFANGVSLGRQACPDHFFYFDVPNTGETVLTAIAGSQRDESRIRKTDRFNEAYRLKEKSAVLNWFDITAPENCFSLNDKVSDLLAAPQTAKLLQSLLQAADSSHTMASAFAQNSDMMQMLGGFTLLRLINLMGAAGVKPSKDYLLALNRQLNQISKS